MTTHHEKPAVLLIDMQEQFWDQRMAAQFGAVPANTERLLATARERGVEVIHLRVEFKADRSDWPPLINGGLVPIEGTPGARPMPWAAALPGEAVFIKHSFDGFVSTSLEAHLRERGIRVLYVSGVLTSICVNLTCASAHQRGFKTYLVDDCCGDDSRENHEWTKQVYSKRAFKVRTLAETLEALGPSG